MTIELASDVRQRLDQHLDAVEQALLAAGRPREQRRAVVDDLETQILDMLTKRCDAPTLAALNEVLAGMDPPAAYGVETTPTTAPAPQAPPALPARPRFSRTAIAGFICICISMLITGVGYWALLPCRKGYRSGAAGSREC